eukprot:scaffold80240_cov28-Tisochrysis_lutea.AAC.1
MPPAPSDRLRAARACAIADCAEGGRVLANETECGLEEGLRQCLEPCHYIAVTIESSLNYRHLSVLRQDMHGASGLPTQRDGR